MLVQILIEDQDDIPLQIVLGGRLEQKRSQSPRSDRVEARMNLVLKKTVGIFDSERNLRTEAWDAASTPTE